MFTMYKNHQQDHDKINKRSLVFQIKFKYTNIESTINNFSYFIILTNTRKYCLDYKIDSD